MTSTQTTQEETRTDAPDEQSLRSKISALDRKIEAQRKHIERLVAELAQKRAERAELVRQRIALLTAELLAEESK